MIKLLFSLVLSLLLPLACRAGDVQYISTAKLLVGGLEVNPKLKNGEPIPESFYGTCVELVQTPEFLNAAHARVRAIQPGVQFQPCKLEAGRLPGTRIIVLRTSAPNADYSLAYLNAVMRELMAKANEMRVEKQQALFAVMNEIKEEIFFGEERIKEAEQNGTKPDQLAEAKAKLQQDKTFLERLVGLVRKTEDRVPAGSRGEIFSVIERTTTPVAVQPFILFPDLFKKLQ